MPPYGIPPRRPGSATAASVVSFADGGIGTLSAGWDLFLMLSILADAAAGTEALAVTLIGIPALSLVASLLLIAAGAAVLRGSPRWRAVGIGAALLKIALAVTFLVLALTVIEGGYVQAMMGIRFAVSLIGPTAALIMLALPGTGRWCVASAAMRRAPAPLAPRFGGAGA